MQRSLMTNGTIPTLTPSGRSRTIATSDGNASQQQDHHQRHKIIEINEWDKMESRNLPQSFTTHPSDSESEGNNHNANLRVFDDDEEEEEENLFSESTFLFQPPCTSGQWSPSQQQQQQQQQQKEDYQHHEQQKRQEQQQSHHKQQKQKQHYAEQQDQEQQNLQHKQRQHHEPPLPRNNEYATAISVALRQNYQAAVAEATTSDETSSKQDLHHFLPSPLVEPDVLTANSSQRVNIVDQVSIKENSWYEDRNLRNVLRESLRDHGTSLHSVQHHDKRNHNTNNKGKTKDKGDEVSSTRSSSGVVQHSTDTPRHQEPQNQENPMRSSSSSSNSSYINVLSPQVRATSDTLGGSISDENWRTKYLQLAQFIQLHGHCDVRPSSDSPLFMNTNSNDDDDDDTTTSNNNNSAQTLILWMKRQRYQYKRKMNGLSHRLTTAREEALRTIGFVWDVRRSAWDDKFDELKVFIQQHGHANCPIKYKENPALGLWVKHQRRLYRLCHHHDHNNINNSKSHHGGNNNNNNNNNSSSNMTNGDDDDFDSKIDVNDDDDDSTGDGDGRKHHHHHQQDDHRLTPELSHRFAQLSSVGFEWNLATNPS